MKPRIDYLLSLVTASLLGASLLGVFAKHADARGRSFPIEVTGRVLTFDRANQTFTIRVDEPANTLTIAVGRDCKFKRNGVPANERILTPGARIKVSYFATIFTGNIAVEIELNSPPAFATGIIDTVDILNRRLIVLIGPNGHRLVLRWAANARFISRGKSVAPASLYQGQVVKVSYYSFEFKSKYAVKVEIRPHLKSNS